MCKGFITVALGVVRVVKCEILTLHYKSTTIDGQILRTTVLKHTGTMYTM